MRKIILFIASSLDGYIARENGDVDWLPESAVSGYDDFYKSVDTVILGKKTYAQVLTFGDYPYKDKKSFVITRNNNCENEDNIKFVNDVEKLVKNIRSSTGANVWLVGGAEIISAFMNFKFVDELVLSIIPVVLGSGIPLFKNIQKDAKLELIKTTTYDALVEMHYKILN
jgi:dihydrofolate reductase